MENGENLGEDVGWLKMWKRLRQMMGWGVVRLSSPGQDTAGVWESLVKMNILSPEIFVGNICLGEWIFVQKIMMKAASQRGISKKALGEKWSAMCDCWPKPSMLLSYATDHPLMWQEIAFYNTYALALSMPLLYALCTLHIVYLLKARSTILAHKVPREARKRRWQLLATYLCLWMSHFTHCTLHIVCLLKARKTHWQLLENTTLAQFAHGMYRERHARGIGSFLTIPHLHNLHMVCTERGMREALAAS